MNILIAEATHHILKDRLEQKGFNCDYKAELSVEDLQDAVSNYDGLVIRSKFKIDKTIIDAAPNLKFIARAGAGMENIDTDYAASKKITCINSPEGNRDSLGEHTVGMLLTLMHKIKIANSEIYKGIWNRKNIGTEVKEKTVGIIGYGNMGSAFAKRLKGFDCRVIAYDKYKTNFSDTYVKEVSLATLFKETDILSIHVPLTEETRYMVNEAFIKQFAKPFILINTARGKILKTDALVESLKTQKITGACLDVLEYEKTSFTDIFNGKDSPALAYLLEAENVILTPHIAGSSDASYKKIAEVLSNKIIRLFG